MIRRFISILSLVVAASCGLGAHAQGEQRDYLLGPGDTIRILVFQNPDLTLETRVSESGTISYPLLGTVKLGGLTVASAEQIIAGALKKGGFIKQPQVNILLVVSRGNQVSVLGLVDRPGRFPWRPSTPGFRRCWPLPAALRRRGRRGHTHRHARRQAVSQGNRYCRHAPRQQARRTMLSWRAAT